MVKKHGADKAAWSVGWLDPEGRRRSKSWGPGERGRKAAEKDRDKLAGELNDGSYDRGNDRGTWKAFRAELDEKVLQGMEPSTRRVAMAALKHFEAIVNPKKLVTIKASAIDQYIAARRKQQGKKRKSMVSTATINKELRHLRALLRYAVDWEYMKKMPRIKLLRESKSIPSFVSNDHFAVIYDACDTAKLPQLPNNVSPADWWRGVLITARMTGWRVNEILSFPKADLDIENAKAVLRADNTKGRREESIDLHPIVIDHIRKVPTFDALVFPWPHGERMLYDEFARIQEAAGIHLPCTEDHEHTHFCHVYGFHDLRRAFATLNAGTLSPNELQKLMRHQSYTTTQLYINMSRQMKDTVAKLDVPTIPTRVAVAD